MDLIAAAATPLATVGAIGIIRISGDAVLNTLEKIFTSKKLNYKKIMPNYMYLGTVNLKAFSDKAFLVYFKAPFSYTGEDVAELHIHGGKTVVNGTLKALFELGVRPAEGGEFTKRAFLNGKLTLNDAEGVMDMINAQSEKMANASYRMLSGEISKTIYKCEEMLLEAAANVEAVLDYPDELSESIFLDTLPILNEVLKILEELIKNSQSLKYIKDGINVTLAGLTNVGKSSLMNALLKDDRAIVTSIAGTTRDTLSEVLEINGIRINLTDTAGIRDSVDTVESMGIERAKRAIKGADLVLFLQDLSQNESLEEQKLFELVKDKKYIIVGNKGDLALRKTNSDVIIEAKNSKNIDKLINLMFEKLQLSGGEPSGVLTRERHIFAVREAVIFIKNAVQNIKTTTPDCLSVDIKSAYFALAQITGREASEAIVDKIFSQFCVGK